MKPAPLYTAENMLINTHISLLFIRRLLHFNVIEYDSQRSFSACRFYIQPPRESSHQGSESHYVAVKTGSVTCWPIRLEAREEAVPYLCLEVLMKLYLLSI